MNLQEELGAGGGVSVQCLTLYIPDRDRMGNVLRDQRRWVLDGSTLLARIGGGVTIMPPVEGGWGDVGNPTNSLLQAYAVNADGFITSGIYAGTYVDGFFAIGPVPEPSAIALAGISTGIFMMYRRRRNRSKGERDSNRCR